MEDTKDNRALYEVVFSNDAAGAHVATRTRGDNILNAIVLALNEKAEDIREANASVSVKVTVIDEAAEAAEREANKHLWAQFEYACTELKLAGFVQDTGTGVWKHANTGISAIVDPHWRGVNNRFVSFGGMRLDDKDAKQFVSYAILPWYGDGAHPAVQYELLKLLVRMVTIQ